MPAYSLKDILPKFQSEFDENIYSILPFVRDSVYEYNFDIKNKDKTISLHISILKDFSKIFVNPFNVPTENKEEIINKIEKVLDNFNVSSVTIVDNDDGFTEIIDKGETICNGLGYFSKDNEENKIKNNDFLTSTFGNFWEDVYSQYFSKGEYELTTQDQTFIESYFVVKEGDKMQNVIKKMLEKMIRVTFPSFERMISYIKEFKIKNDAYVYKSFNIKSHDSHDDTANKLVANDNNIPNDVKNNTEIYEEIKKQFNIQFNKNKYIVKFLFEYNGQTQLEIYIKTRQKEKRINFITNQDYLHTTIDFKVSLDKRYKIAYVYYDQDSAFIVPTEYKQEIIVKIEKSLSHIDELQTIIIFDNTDAIAEILKYGKTICNKLGYLPYNKLIITEYTYDDYKNDTKKNNEFLKKSFKDFYKSTKLVNFDNDLDKQSKSLSEEKIDQFLTLEKKYIKTNETIGSIIKKMINTTDKNNYKSQYTYLDAFANYLRINKLIAFNSVVSKNFNGKLMKKIKRTKNNIRDKFYEFIETMRTKKNNFLKRNEGGRSKKKRIRIRKRKDKFKTQKRK